MSLPAFVFSKSGLEEIELPRSVVCIEDRAFWRCKDLKHVVADGVETIGERAFAGSGLGSFRAPRSLRQVGSYAFAGCKTLRHVDLRDGQMDLLSEGAFEGSKLEEILLPDALRTIGPRAFLGCGCLRAISFGVTSKLEEIGCKAFYGSGLETFAASPSL